MLSLLLATTAMTLGQTFPGTWQLRPYFPRGLELVYKGEYLEETLVPGVRHQRKYRLETLAFFNEASKEGSKVGLQTTVTLVRSAAEKPGDSLPGSVRLEVLGVGQRGGLADARSSALLIPLSGPPLLETGIFFEAPLIQVRPDYSWEIMEEGRPARVWKVEGLEQQHGTSCIKLVARQQSDDWDRPRADRVAWYRTDVLWFAPQYGLVVRLERTISRREPARSEPTHRAVVVYDLDSKLQYRGKLFDDRQKELLLARRHADDAFPLLRQPTLYRTQIKALHHRIAYHLEHHPPTPFRRSLVHLQGRLESAQSGVIPASYLPDEDTPAIRNVASIGKKVPDVVVTDLINKKTVRLHTMLGKPVVIFYYNPTTTTGQQILRYAHSLYKKQGERIHLMPMAVTSDLELVQRQHRDLALPFSILDGKAMHRTFGVDATPRLIVLDAAGLVRWAGTGWGFHTADEINRELAQIIKN